MPATLVAIGLLLTSVACATADAAWPPAPPLERPIDVDAGPLPDSVEAQPLPSGQWRCTFRFKPGPDAQSVSLAGTFNQWNAGAMPLKGPRGDGFWLGEFELAPGRHEYKFVIDGDDWRTDPLNPETVQNDKSTRNSVLRLGRAAHLEESAAEPGDGDINVDGLAHDPALPLYFQALSADEVLLRYRTLTDDVDQITAVIRGGASFPMVPLRRDPLFTLYQTRATLPPSTRQDGRVTLEYTFVLADGETRASAPEPFNTSFNVADIFTTPDWAKHAVWYQIMPDRFRNGDTSNDPPRVHPWTSDWFAAQPWEEEREQKGESFYHWYVFDRLYGGDFAGIEEQLPYLKDLGVTAIYLNPVFIAESHHKYNATNYLHIDPDFGVGREHDDYDEIVATEDLRDPGTWKWTKSDRRFLQFIQRCHAADIKVIIDGVFNHVGTQHPAFQDVREHGRDSRYADWFNVTSWEPFEYRGWGGFDALPEFRKTATGLASESAKEHIFNVTRRWMDPDGDGDPSDGIDGWRLDVPNELPAPFWAEWRRVVKSTNPDAYITGEIWDRADTWLDGRHFDAVMNYQFVEPTVQWIINRKQKITVSELDRRLESLRFAYPLPATLVLQNLVDSHDTDRVASMTINPDRGYDEANRIQDNGPRYNNAKPPAEGYQQVRLIALLQMTYIGAPMIYYGDEVGMWGADDPTCRKPMLWEDLQPYENPDENHVMPEHRDFYKRAIALRHAHPALRTGAFTTLLTDDRADVWAFLRSDDDEQLIVVLNASKRQRQVQVPLPDAAARRWQGVFATDETFTARDGRLTVSVPGIAGVVLHAPAPR